MKTSRVTPPLALCLLTLSVLFLLVACGGSSSDGSPTTGVLISGTLVEGDESGPTSVPVGNVQICALAGCDTSDPTDGSFQFFGGAGFAGGPVQFTFEGNGVSADTIISIDETTTEATGTFVVLSPSLVVSDGFEEL